MNRRTRAMPLVVVGALALVVAACGSDDDGDGDVAAPPGNGDRVDLTGSPLGEILVDGDGMVLYLFTVDEPGTSNCHDECLEAWPPLAGEPEAGSGVDASLLGSIERDDGTVQATYGDWPLYYYAGDSSAGDLHGQGLNDVWYVLDAGGNAIEDAVPDDMSDDDDDNGGGRSDY
ncbi:COG4315 family predicted lipoprotein [Phytoactinopolyspora limicola]|uniref:COG4315 family predicted lipoprotein n=1 Tax=Phytoactinopolyspora limicola TaxID=2715536 RepID=UPI00140BA0DB|nr:hypothetical protein [Phytoactinopolyspora limicola]